MACLDESRVVLLCRRDTPGPLRQELLAHVDSCAECQAVVAAVARTSLVFDASTESMEMPSASRPDALALRRGTQIGRFTLLDCVGRGAMGAVYAAHDPQLKRTVAFKLLHGTADRGLSRIEREAQALARLSHPNVVPVFDVGTFGGRVYMAMEYVEGESVAAWLRGATRTLPEILRVFRQAGEALYAAHAAGIVHRDFKPENVLVGRDGRVRVVDFGLAVASDAPADTRASAPAALAGTPAYMAPEALRGAPADARSDQFSFCVALYEALFSTRPFPAATKGELAAKLAADAPVRPVRGFGARAHVYAVLRRGLRADPAARHASMTALLSALDRATAARPARWPWIAAATAMLACVAALVMERGQGPRERAGSPPASASTATREHAPEPSPISTPSRVEAPATRPTATARTRERVVARPPPPKPEPPEPARAEAATPRDLFAYPR